MGRAGEGVKATYSPFLPFTESPPRSPATSKKDFTDKYAIYQFVGVREYWVVHPHEATVLIYQLDDQGNYQLLRKTPFLKHETAPVGVFSDFGVHLERVFG